jgi:hypothetical protein
MTKEQALQIRMYAEDTRDAAVRLEQAKVAYNKAAAKLDDAINNATPYVPASQPVEGESK